jgi:hypothetical protein
MSWADEPTCAAHRWRWVRTWNDIGYRECWLCGYCGPVVSRGEAGEVEKVGPKVGPTYLPTNPAADMDRPAATPGRQRSRPTRAAAALRFDAVVAELATGAKAPEIAAKLCISEARVYQIQRVVRKRLQEVAS